MRILFFAAALLWCCQAPAVTVWEAPTLLAVYAENEVRADQMLKGKSLFVKGTVKSIGRDILGTAYLTLDAGKQFVFVQCYFGKSSEDRVAKLNPGDVVVIMGECNGKLSNVFVKKCELLTKDQIRQIEERNQKEWQERHDAIEKRYREETAKEEAEKLKQYKEARAKAAAEKPRLSKD